MLRTIAKRRFSYYDVFVIGIIINAIGHGRYLSAAVYFIISGIIWWFFIYDNEGC